MTTGTGTLAEFPTWSAFFAAASLDKSPPLIGALGVHPAKATRLQEIAKAFVQRVNRVNASRARTPVRAWELRRILTTALDDLRAGLAEDAVRIERLVVHKSGGGASHLLSGALWLWVYRDGHAPPLTGEDLARLRDLVTHVVAEDLWVNIQADLDKAVPTLWDEQIYRAWRASAGEDASPLDVLTDLLNSVVVDSIKQSFSKEQVRALVDWASSKRGHS